MSFIQQFFGDLRTPLYRNAFYLMMNAVVVNGLGLVFWMVAARYYAPHEVGLAAAIIPVMGLISILSGFGFGVGLVRFLPSSGENSRAMINSCLTISGLAAILISLVFLMGLDIWSPALLFIRKNWIFFLCFVLFSVVVTLNPIINTVFVAGRDTKFVLAGTSIGGLRVFLPIVFASLFGAFGIFASWGLAALIALVVGVLLFIPKVNPGYRPLPTVRKNVVNDMVRFSAGNYVAGVFAVIPTAVLPLIIVNTLSAENVAYYYIAVTIAGLLFAIAGAVCTSLFAEGSHCERHLNDDVRKALKLIFLLLVPAIIIILLFGEYLFMLFGDQYSTEGLALLQIFAISSVFMAFNGIFIATRQVLKRVKPIIVLTGFSAFATIGLGYVFLLWMGLVGIAIAWTLSKGIVSAGIGMYVLEGRRRGGYDKQP